MESRRRFVPLVSVAVLAAGLFLLAGGAGIRARPAVANGVQHFSLPALAMHPVDWRTHYDGTSGYLMNTGTTDVPIAFVEPLNLPDGATIVGAQAFGLDDNMYSEFSFYVFRVGLQSDPVLTPVSRAGGSGDSYNAGKITVTAAVTPSLALVDNVQYSYGIYLNLDVPVAGYGPVGVLRFLVDANYPLALPTVLRQLAP
jgi:hypothetical protein